MGDSVGADSRSRRRRKLRRLAQTFLPDDVVINILSWLPAKDVLRYHLVCKLWKDLTSSNDFIHLHFRHGIPMILKEENPYRLPKRVLLDRCWEPAQTKSKIHKIYGPPNSGYMHFSHNGLLVVDDGSYSDPGFIIYNPVYRDAVKITVQERGYDCRYTMCGVFFHPGQNEYCSLWRKTLSLRPYKFQYRILNLESDPKWRDIATQNLEIWDYSRPVVIGKNIYWIVEPFRRSDYYEVMEYDIIKEEFRVIKSMVHVQYGYKYVNILDIDGVLSLIDVVPAEESFEINIWTLNNGGEQLWTSFAYVVSSSSFVSNYGSPMILRAIVYRNGELVLKANERLYVYNLESGKVRKFGTKYNSVEFWPHVISLVSVKNWRSDIHVADEDEIDDGNNQA